MIHTSAAAMLPQTILPAGATRKQRSRAMAQSPLLTFYVHRMQFETESIRSIELRPADGGPLPPFTAGAHIDIQLPDGDFRSYSLTNRSTQSAGYEIAVNRDAKSRGGSLHMCDVLRVGDTVLLRPPANHFELADTKARSVFLAGGIGITPVIAMIRHLDHEGRPWTLHFAARSRRHAAFIDLLSAWEVAAPGRVHLHFDDEHEGRPLDIAGLCTGADKTTHFYCCGPTPMIDAFKTALADRPEEQVHSEHFSGVAAVASERRFQLVLARSKREFLVLEGQSIMQVLEENDVFVPSSCRQGVCGTCETRVVEGVPDHRDSILSPREHASNKTMMICCSGSKSDRLVLDL
jgi:ferredoxin-NADP reductase